MQGWDIGFCELGRAGFGAPLDPSFREELPLASRGCLALNVQDKEMSPLGQPIAND